MLFATVLIICVFVERVTHVDIDGGIVGYTYDVIQCSCRLMSVRLVSHTLLE